MKFAVIAATLAVAQSAATEVDLSKLTACGDACKDETVCCAVDKVADKLDEMKDLCHAKGSATGDAVAITAGGKVGEDDAEAGVESKLTCAEAEAAASTKVGFAAAAMAAAYYMA